jgi:hypothetical protein
MDEVGEVVKAFEGRHFHDLRGGSSLETEHWWEFGRHFSLIDRKGIQLPM